MKRFVLAALMASLLLSGTGAAAVTFDGEWPDGDRPVTLDIDRQNLSQALRALADAAGLNLVASLDRDPPVSLHVREAAPREVLAALLGDADVVVHRQGSMVSLRAPTAVAGALPAIALPVPPAPPAPPIPPAPPAPPRHGPAISIDGDRVAAGHDIVVRAGERVHDVVSMGGDIVVDGEVTGDAVSMGGDIRVRRGGTVRGNTVLMGGELIVEDGADLPSRHAVTAQRPTVPIGPAARLMAFKNPRAMHGHGSDLPGAIMRYLLLFVLGVVLRGAAADRLGALQRTLVRRPARSGLTGVLGFCAGVVLVAVLAISIIGIPAAVVAALALPAALYVGLAAAATVIGAALPLKALKDLPAMQLAAGVIVLFLLSRVPVLGCVAIALVALAGLGAVIQTRFGTVAPGDPGAPIADGGPYRTAADR